MILYKCKQEKEINMLVDCGGRWYEVPSNEPTEDYIEDLPEPEPDPLCRIETSEDGEF